MASNMYYSNNVIQSSDTNITSAEIYDHYNLVDTNYNIGDNNYSSTIYNEVSTPYYISEESTKIKNLLKPRYNINSVNVNPYLRKNNPYGIDGLMNYAIAKTYNPIISTFNSYHIPKTTIQRAISANKSLSTSNKLLNKNQSVYDAVINENIETQPTLHLINKDFNQIYNTNSNYLQNNNSSLLKSVQIPSQFVNNLNLNNNQFNKSIQTTRKRNNLRYSVPVRMNPLFSISNFQQRYSKDIKVEEIASKIDEKEYYRVNKSGLIVDYAYYEDPNKGNRDYMEDRGRAIENLNNDPNKILFCIFDGHGGSEASVFLQENFHIYLKKYLPFNHIFEDITNTFRNLDDKLKTLDIPDVGSTGTIVYIEKVNNKRILYCANVGDSRCVLVNRKGIMRMSHDDRVEDKKEYERVIRQGGVIFNGRVYGTLMLTRCFGDWAIKKYGVVVEPHIIKIELNEDDLYLLIASDGLWDVINDEECKGFTEIYDNSLDTCKNLVKECLNRRSTDNISCFVLKLN